MVAVLGAWHCATKPRWGRVALVATCLILVVIPPVVAFAAQITYASGTNGSGSTWSTGGETNRSYNQVFHQSGKTWRVSYLHSGSETGVVQNSSNPTQNPNASSSAAFARCGNVNDNSGVTWTCQTTTP